MATNPAEASAAAAVTPSTARAEDAPTYRSWARLQGRTARLAALHRRAWRRLSGGRTPMPEVRVISYPKCERTWLKVLLGRALCTPRGLDPKLLLDTEAVTAATGGLRTDFSHEDSDLRYGVDHGALREDKRAYRECKVIFLARDLRDVLVSS